jgi:hypothetical protein
MKSTIFSALALLLPALAAVGEYYRQKMSSTPNPILAQLTGAWGLLDHCAFLPHDEQDRAYPLGEPKGMLLFTADGYMSTQILSSSAENSSKDSDPAFAGTKYMSYSGRYHFEEDKETQRLWLETHVLLSYMPDMVGSAQRRLVKFTLSSEGSNSGNNRTCLVLQPEQPMKVAGVDRVMRVRWVKLPSGDSDQITKQSGI